jgi:hypothetical protein
MRDPRVVWYTHNTFDRSEEPYLIEESRPMLLSSSYATILPLVRYEIFCTINRILVREQVDVACLGR